MDLIGRLARFGVPLLGGRSSTVAMTYRMRGSYVTQSITAITRKGYRAAAGHCITTSPNSPWLKIPAVIPVPGGVSYTKARCSCAVSHAPTVGISSPANSVSLRTSPSRVPSRVPHHQTQYLHAYRRRGAALPLPLSSPRLFSTTSRVSCSVLIPSSIMTDRDILPGIVKPSHYDLSISSMNFDDWSYQGRVS